jgi:hypothetical protein
LLGIEEKFMGDWGYAPWDNDYAADWYGVLMERTRLREFWLDGIERNPEDNDYVVRAAAALFLMLGRIYIWPVENYDDDLEKTIAALSRVAELEDVKELPELVNSIEQELVELKSRRKEHRLSSASQQKPWWKPL